MAKTSKKLNSKTAAPTIKVTKALQNRIEKAKANAVPKNAGQAAMAKLFSAPEPDQVKVHKDGTIERIGKVTMDDICHFLKGRRAFDGAEVMEELHKESIKFMVDAGYAVPVMNAQSRNIKNTMYFVTAKAAERFNLRPVTSFGMPFKFVEA